MNEGLTESTRLTGIPTMRMLCTSCWRTARPDTRFEGSDRLELLAWLCLGLPGLLYCYWRQATRTKVCPACGSADLVREARAARRRGGELAWGGGRMLVAGRLPWPRILDTPARRLVHGGLGVLVFGALGIERIVAQLAPVDLGLAASPALSVACALWLLWQGLRLRRPVPVPCQAFDESGRALPVEALL